MKMHRIVPALLATAGAAIPLATGTEIIIHSGSSSAAAALPAAPAATAPPATAGGAATPSSPAPISAAASPTATAPGPTTAVPTPTPAVTSRTIQGPIVQYQFGTVQATVTLTGKKITDVTINANGDEPRSQDINSQAVPYLRSETLQAQSANVSIVSGATLTSEAYAQSLQAALQQAGI